jgi:N-acyl-L-homoserine lactone synthetase
MKVHIVTAANRSSYTTELEQMFRLRHRVFVEELGWHDLRATDGREIDQFDGEESAVYLLACERGEVHGSLRLLPTWRRCMLQEIWPEYLSQGETICGPGVWEWTRWCPGSITRRRHLIKARNALIVAALEFARSRGIRTYVTLCDVKFLGQSEEIGWTPRPLGLPRSFGQGTAIGLEWQVTPRLLEDTRRVLHVKDAASLELPAPGGTEVVMPPHLVERLFSVKTQEMLSQIEDVLGNEQGQRRVSDMATVEAAGRA